MVMRVDEQMFLTAILMLIITGCRI